jgi:CheY-like chemotaxis protein
MALWKEELPLARILIVEDEALIAMMLEEWVVELGHTPVGPVGNVAKALALINETVCDAAILDYNLGGETAGPISELLATRNVPFAFASGDHAVEIDERFRQRPMLPKPYVFESVHTVVLKLLSAEQLQSDNVA